MFIDFNVKLIYNEMHNSYIHVVLVLKNAYWNNFDVQSPIKKNGITISAERYLMVLVGQSLFPFPRGNHCSDIFYLLNLPFFIYCITIIIQLEIFSGLLLWHTVMFLRFIYSFRLLCISIIPFVLLVVFHYITIPQFSHPFDG